jgi:hypothetical protein
MTVVTGTVVAGWRRARWGVLAGLLVALAGACGAPPPPSAADAGLTGSIMQYRSDTARRVLTVRVRAAAPVEIREVLARPVGFEPTAPAVLDTRLGVGNTVDVRLAYGAARCGEPLSGDSEAEVEVVRDGRSSRVRLTLADEYGQMARLNTTECAEQAVRAQAEFAFTGGWAPDPTGRLMRSTLTLRRVAGDAEVTVVELGSTTLFALRGGPAGGPVVALPPGTAQASVPIEVETVRCDSHALAESKRATVFGMFVGVGGAEAVSITVSPDDTGVDALVRFATESCAGRS